MFDLFKRFGGQVIIYGFGDAINKILMILTVPLFSRYLTPAEYGVAGVLAVTTALLLGLGDLGLTNGIFRFFYDEKEPRRSHLIVTTQIATVAITSAIALLSLIFSHQLSSLFFKSPDYNYVVVLSFFTIPFQMAVQPPLIRLKIEEKVRRYTVLALLRVIASVALSAFLIIGLGRGLNGFFEGPLIAAIIFAIYILLSSLKDQKIFFSRELFRKMFFFGSPYIFSAISIWVINWADRFVLTRLSNLTEVGLYTLGYTVGMAVMLPIGAFQSAWNPFFMSISKKPDAKEIYCLVFTYFFLIISFFVLFVAVFARDFFYFFTPASYHDAFNVVPVVSLAYILNGAFAIITIGSFLAKKPILDMITELIGVVINLVLLFVLIPYFGRMGAAWATLGAYLALPVIMLFLLRKVYPIKYDFQRVIRIALVGFGLYFACKFIWQPSILNLLWRMLIILSYPLFLFVLGFFKEGELKRFQIIKNRIWKRNENSAGAN